MTQAQSVAIESSQINSSGVLQVAGGGTGTTTSTGTGALVLNTSPTLTTPLINQINTSVTNTSLGAGNASIMKNRIINGAMVIDQRDAGASVTPVSGQYTLDRFQFYMSQASKFSVQQNASAVTPPVGFIGYLGVNSSSAYSVTSTDFFNLLQTIEGYNCADLGWGTANAKTVTLSFQVYSSLTGTFGGVFQNAGGTRFYPYSYSIPVANTWTPISVTVAGDTAGTWPTNNTGCIQVRWGLGVGSTYSGTAGAWGSTAYASCTGAVSVVGTNNATFYITGVQLEVGSFATGFEYRQYQQELALCQRYFQQFGGTSSYEYIGDCICANTTLAYAGISLTTTMRSAPTVAYTGSASDFTLDAGSSNTQCTSIVMNSSAVNKVRLTASVTAGLITTSYRTFLSYSTQTSKIQLSAEL